MKKQQLILPKSLLSLMAVTTCVLSFALPKPASRPNSRIQMSQERDNDEDILVDFSEVSDAETLLACRAYLQRRNKLGWKQFERRKQAQQQSSALFPSFSKDSVGYFWEDPSELLYTNNNSPDGDRPSYGDLISEEQQDFLLQPHADQVVFENYDDGDTSIYSGGGVFTTHPSGPSEERIRRSNAKSAQWQDAEFRKKWYEKRWAGKTIMTEEFKKNRRLDEKLLAVPSEIVDSKELAAMTEEEIYDAVVIYVISNRRRGKSMKNRTSYYVEARTDEKLPRDALFCLDEAAMKDKQRLRSERAKAAYQKRLENQGSFSIVPKINTRSFVPRFVSPKEALFRINADLQLQRLPTLQDVKIMLQPKKLGRRRDILRRILNEHFNLRGKCVPVDFDKPNGECMFVTLAPIDHLGKFVIRTIGEGLQQWPN